MGSTQSQRTIDTRVDRTPLPAGTVKMFVDGARRDFDGLRQRRIGRVAPAQLREPDLAAGCMDPKVEAVRRFVKSTDDMAAVGRLDNAYSLSVGTAGTVITPVSITEDPQALVGRRSEAPVCSL